MASAGLSQKEECVAYYSNLAYQCYFNSFWTTMENQEKWAKLGTGHRDDTYRVNSLLILVCLTAGKTSLILQHAFSLKYVKVYISSWPFLFFVTVQKLASLLTQGYSKKFAVAQSCFKKILREWAALTWFYLWHGSQCALLPNKQSSLSTLALNSQQTLAAASNAKTA